MGKSVDSKDGSFTDTIFSKGEMIRFTEINCTRLFVKGEVTRTHFVIQHPCSRCASNEYTHKPFTKPGMCTRHT